MKKLFLLVVVCFIAFFGCERKERLVLTIVWEPPEHVQTESVVVEGWYRAQNGAMRPWGTLCRMERARGLLSSGKYWCEFAIPPGSDMVWNIKYTSRTALGGFCWVFDHSNDQPCGGRGQDVGSISASYNDREISAVPVWNGLGPSDPPIYFNARSTTLR